MPSRAPASEPPDPPPSADLAYDALRRMLVTCRLRPGERVNEVALARALGVSRTPLREALNRLVTEGFLTRVRNRGFSCRLLDAHEIHDLYDLRAVIERASARRACAHAADDEVARFAAGAAVAAPGRDVAALVAADEAFHLGLARLGGNRESERVLANVNARIRFARWLDMEGRVGDMDEEHRRIAEAIAARDAERAEALVGAHVSRRLDQIVATLEKAYARIWMEGRIGAQD